MRRLTYNPDHEHLDYLRGIILSDGYVRQRDGVRVSTANIDFANHFRQRGYGVTEQVAKAGFNPGASMYSVRIGNLAFVQSLEFEAGEKTTHFRPNENWKIKEPWEFIAGMIDGDGSVSGKVARVEIAISCTDIVDLMKDTYRAVGVENFSVYKRNDLA